MKKPVQVAIFGALLSALVALFSLLPARRGEKTRAEEASTTRDARPGGNAGLAAPLGLREPTPSDDMVSGSAELPIQESNAAAPAGASVAFEVRVWQPGGLPAAGVSVLVGATGAQVHGLTNAAGSFACRVESRHLPVCEVSVMPAVAGYAWSRTNCVDRNEDLRRGEEMVLEVRLVAGAALRIMARGERGEGLVQHLVQADYRGPKAGTGVWGQRLAMTDGRGYADLPGLEPGAWDVYVPHWKGHGVSEHVSLDLLTGRQAEQEVFVPELPRDAFSSGQFSSLAGGATDEFGRLLGVRLERSDGRASDLFIHADGSFFIQGGPPDLRVRPVDQRDHRYGGWIPIRPGLHHGDIEPGW